MKTSKTTQYKQPGAGAIEFAATFMEGTTFTTGMPVIKQLMEGKMHDPNDKKVKTCAFCGYYYRDKTKNNSSKTCSPECKIDLDTFRRAQKKADKELLNPKKVKDVEVKYVYWLEYPFWNREYDMLKNSWKYEAPYSPDKIEQINAAKQRAAMLGGKRKPKRVVPYNGDEKGSSKVSVNFGKKAVNKKPSEVVSSRMSPEEMKAYFESKYTEEHLRKERWRAMNTGILATVKKYKGKDK